jgi:hypothetical protein
VHRCTGLFNIGEHSRVVIGKERISASLTSMPLRRKPGDFAEINQALEEKNHGQNQPTFPSEKK